MACGGGLGGWVGLIWVGWLLPLFGSVGEVADCVAKRNFKPIYEMNEINVYICCMKCLECEKELINTEGKRPKKFCNNTCRSNYWQKENRKKKSIVAIQNLNEPTGTKETKPPSTTNTTIDTRKPFMSEAIKKKLGL